jgi:hypothetical protein
VESGVVDGDDKVMSVKQLAASIATSQDHAGFVAQPNVDLHVEGHTVIIIVCSPTSGTRRQPHHLVCRSKAIATGRRLGHRPTTTDEKHR